jgi:hypothetical protein
MTMRLAIQFFGHLRSFKSSAESFLKNIVVPNERAGYEVDIFIHTWDELEHSTANYRNPEGVNLSKAVTKEDISTIEFLYHPKKLLVEKQLDVSDEILTEKIGKVNRSYKGYVNVAYTVFRGNELRKKYEMETGVNYDWVIVTRPDIQFLKPFEINDIINVYKHYDIDIPKKAIFHGSNIFGRGFVEDRHLLAGSDIFYLGMPEVMNSATNLYPQLDQNLDKKDLWCLEQFWVKYWEKQGIEKIPIKYRHGLEFEVLRISENEQKLMVHYKLHTFKRIVRQFLQLTAWILPYFIAVPLLKRLGCRILL